MANGIIGVQEPISPTKKLDTEELTVGSNTVERERVQIAGSADVEVARVINTAPAGTEYGVVTRNIPTAGVSSEVDIVKYGGTATTLGQKASAASIPVVLASDQSSVTVTSSPPFATRSDTFTATGNGVTVDKSAAPVKSFSIEVKGTGAAPTTWDVRLEGSLDGTNFTSILQHTNLTGDGVTVFSGQNLGPSLFFRSRVAGLALGAATNIVVTILGMG